MRYGKRNLKAALSSCFCSRFHHIRLTNLLTMDAIRNFNDLTARLKQAGGRKRVAMACPADPHTEYVVRRALDEGIADFILVCAGQPAPEFAALCRQYPGHAEALTEADADSTARRAVELVRTGHADILMKGTLNTDNLLHAVLDKEHGLLEPGRVLSHVTATFIPAYGKMLVFADAAVIPRPTLEQFDAILCYAAGVSRRLGVERPAVALVNFTEKVNSKFPHSIYYEELKRCAAEGRYGDICVDGPMDVKTALDTESGLIKGIASPVAGYADVLIFPNIESGNVFYKTITLFASAETAGMLCGTTAPVVVASRADSCESKFYSLAMACC